MVLHVVLGGQGISELYFTYAGAAMNGFYCEMQRSRRLQGTSGVFASSTVLW